MKTIRTIAYIIIFYVAAFVVWWMILLARIEKEKFEFQIENFELKHQGEIPREQFEKAEKEFKSNQRQIIYEGVAFLILLAGSSLYVIRGINREKKFQELKRNFLLATTHEFKTPLSATKLNLQTLQKKQLNQEKEDLLLSNSLSEIERLNQLVNNILLASKIDATEYQFGKETVNLSNLTKKVIKSHPEKSRIKSVIQENIFVEADAMSLEIVLANLIDNALKYSPKEEMVELLLNGEGEKLILKVIDQGIGIPNDERARIFERFYRIEDEQTRKTKGTGLGLFLVKEMVNNRKGSIEITNNKPKGSIFTVTLPAKNE